jgi:hypothetical protein
MGAVQKAGVTPADFVQQGPCAPWRPTPVARRPATTWPALPRAIHCPPLVRELALILGHNVLLVAKEDGHSPHTMLTTCAAWTEGATEGDVETIRRALERSPSHAGPVGILAPDSPRICHWVVTRS